jgi:hypothetical protein
MSAREEDVRALLDRSKRDFRKIETEYKSSLSSKSIHPDLRIEIKNFCANLRSVLDYLAHDIRETYCPSAKDGEHFYFPITSDESQFRAVMDKWFPSLEATCPDLWAYLESVQPYKGNGNRWLGQFNRLNNENKHAALVEQTKAETEEVKVTTPGAGQVSWNPDAVRFGPGVFIGGVPVDPVTQMPVPHPSLKVERIRWVDFQFEGLGVSALSLLKQSLDGVETIASRILALLHK